MKLSARTGIVLLAMLTLALLFATDQILPASTPYQAQMRVWLAARATGIVALVLLTAIVVLGVVLSHPHQPQWKTAKAVFPWHESLWIFVIAFLVIHVLSLVVDKYAGVGIGGALVPGLSTYRSVPVALGVIGLYALVITALTARYTKLLPRGLWLKLHRLSAVVLGLAWAHGVLAGTDTDAIRPLYWLTGVSVLVAVMYRYWVVRMPGRRRAREAAAPDGAMATSPIRVVNE